jgi:mannose-6-phosphate isomerase-like protein (cupin superfamily)
VGHAHFYSDRGCLAYLNFPDAESLAANRHPHRLHLHRESWEFYTVLRGEDVLRIEQELVTIQTGEILVVPPGTRHVQHAKGFPFEGITFRTPLLNDKMEF